MHKQLSMNEMNAYISKHFVLVAQDYFIISTRHADLASGDISGFDE